MDTLIEPRWLIPVEPTGQVLEQHALLIRDGRIAAIEPVESARSQWPDADRVVLERHALIPGLVNAHTHAAMSLMRGLADDLPLMTWLEQHIWPTEAAHVSADFVADGVRLAIAEMLRSGTTCFNDMYFFPDITGRIASETGIRASAGLILLDFPTVWADGPDSYLDKAIEVHDEFRDNPLVSTAFAPHAPYTVSDDPLKRMQMLADELDIPVHMHVHETAGEVQMAIDASGKRPMQRLQELGLTTNLLNAVHMTQLTDEEIQLCATNGITITHCPESNMKLASGGCRVHDLLQAGVTVALGTDGAASNNDLDMLGEMRTAALLAKHISGNASALPAAEALRMATLSGARAMGLGKQTGSISVGKWADLCAIDLGAPETQPMYDVVSQIVYASGREQVTDTWVAGRRLLRNQHLETIDIDAVMASTTQWGERIAASRQQPDSNAGSDGR